MIRKLHVVGLDFLLHTRRCVFRLRATCEKSVFTFKFNVVLDTSTTFGIYFALLNSQGLILIGKYIDCYKSLEMLQA